MRRLTTIATVVVPVVLMAACTQDSPPTKSSAELTGRPSIPTKAVTGPGVVRPGTICAQDANNRNAETAQADGSHVSVFFSCKADAASLGLDSQPLYPFVRAIPRPLAGSIGGRLVSALDTYLEGPTKKERAQGYFTASGSALAGLIQDVAVTGHSATVDFDGAIKKRAGNLGTSTASMVFLHELQAVAFQFPRVDSLILSVEGDCDRFWRLLEGSCQTIGRR